MKMCTTGKSYFAESRHLCQELSSRHSAKSFLCREPRQALGKGLFAESRKQTVGKEALCREHCPRQRRALGKVPVHQTPAAGVPFAESLPFGSRQRKALCRVLAGKALGKAIFAECLGWLSAKYFYFFLFFFAEFFFGALCHYCKLYFNVWKKFEFFLVYLTDLFCFFVCFGINQM